MARKKGQGNIREKNGRFYLRRKINGKEKAILLDAKTRKQAEEEAKSYIPISNIKTEQELLLFTARNRSLIKKEADYQLKDIFDRFKNHPGRGVITEKTLNQHRTYWNLFLTWAENYRPELTKGLQIDKNIAHEFFIYLSSLKQGQSYNYVLITLKYIYRLLYPDQLNPFNTISKKYFAPKPRKEFNVHMFNQILDAFEDPRLYVLNKPQMKVLFYIAAYSGMRFKDCIRFNDDQVNYKRDIVKCIPCKTRKKRPDYVHIPMSLELKEQLLIAESWKEKGLYVPALFQRYHYNEWGVTRDANKVINWGLWQDDKSKDLCQRTKATHNNSFTFSSLRHTFVSFCANAGVPLEYVAAIVGHSCVSMTRYYTHLNQQSLSQVLNALPSRRK